MPSSDTDRSPAATPTSGPLVDFSFAEDMDLVRQTFWWTCVCSCGSPYVTNDDCGPGGSCKPGLSCCVASPADEEPTGEDEAPSSLGDVANAGAEQASVS